MRIAFALIPIGQNNLSNRQTEKDFFACRTKNPPFLFEVCEITPTFVAFFHRNPLTGGAEGKEPIYRKGVLNALFLTLRNLAIPKRLSIAKQQRRPVDMLLMWLLKPLSCISAWASALLVSTNKQCQSFEEWDEQKRGSHAFHF